MRHRPSRRARHRHRRQLGIKIECSASPRWARGIGGLLVGSAAGAILGVLVGGAVGVNRLTDNSSETAPIRGAVLTAFGLTIAGAVAGAVVGTIPPEC
jgi:hypothetical protein